MLLVLINWCWILFCSFVIGIAIIRTVNKKFLKEREPELAIVIGLMVLTVYAQLTTLVIKISLAASLLLLLSIFILTFLLLRDLKEYLHLCFRVRNIRLFIIILLAGLIILFYTSQSAIFYDTDLYHAQAIRWMEEFKIVKGLGNLHNRFAYNSAFLPLQALFSWKFLGIQSLHTLNGFFCIVMSTYAICSLNIWKREKLRISDFLKLGIVIYIFSSLEFLASPVTDTFPMLTVLYVLAKWCEYQEHNQNNYIRYLILCFLAVWAVTIKLSVVGLLLLALYPAYRLCKQKRWRTILISLAIGMSLVLPYVLRNFYISGYLVYPYPFPDLFQVDWKMPLSLVRYDKNEIMVWGRGLNDVSLYDWPLMKWFPVWFGRLNFYDQVMFRINVVLAAVSTGYILIMTLGKKWKMECFLLLVSIINFLIWFFTAPLPRYGMVYFLLLPCILAGMITIKIKQRSYQIVIAALMILFCSYQTLNSLKYFDSYKLFLPIDYQMRQQKEVNWYGTMVYLPEEGDQIGYHYFPSTPYLEKLILIEPRGASLQDGFRMKEEYLGKNITTAGAVVD